MNDNAAAFNAGEYDSQIKKTIPYYEEFYQQIVGIAEVQFCKPIRWLDVGCGTGKMAEAAFENINVEKFVFCDDSPQMIEIAKKRFQRQNTEFFNTSILALDWSEQFDMITAVQVLHYFQKEERMIVIQKCYKALCNNGIFITFENFAPNSGAGQDLFLERWKLYQLSQGRSEEECDNHIARYGKKYFPITIIESMEILNQSGFRCVEIIWLSNMQVGIMGIK